MTYQPETYVSRQQPVKAMQVLQGRQNDIARWCGGEVSLVGVGVTVPTMMGTIDAEEGDYVYQRADGKFAVQSDRDFETSYKKTGVRQNPLIPRGTPVHVSRSEEVRKAEHEESKGTFFGLPRLSPETD